MSQKFCFYFSFILIWSFTGTVVFHESTVVHDLDLDLQQQRRMRESVVSVTANVGNNATTGSTSTPRPVIFVQPPSSHDLLQTQCNHSNVNNKDSNMNINSTSLNNLPNNFGGDLGEEIGDNRPDEVLEVVGNHVNNTKTTSSTPPHPQQPPPVKPKPNCHTNAFPSVSAELWSAQSRVQQRTVEELEALATSTHASVTDL